MERWRDIDGYEGVYEVSSEGRVRRVASGPGARAGHVLKGGKLKNGTVQVVLTKDSRPTTHRINRLVAAAFLPPPPTPRHVLHHLDDDKSNNAADNIAWGTRAEESFRQVLRGTQKGRHHGREGALSDADVLAIRADTRAEKAIARDYGIAPGTVGQIRRRQTYKHLAPRPGDYAPIRNSLRFTDAQVRAIRVDPRPDKEVAAEFDCSCMTIWCIRTGRSYGSVLDTPENGTFDDEPRDELEAPDTSQHNKIAVYQDHAAIRLPCGRETFIDIADVASVEAYRWTARVGDRTAYAVARQRDEDGRVWSLGLHRLLLNPQNDFVVDHINGNGLDNRRANLRLATPAQNNLNSRVRSDCISGLKGAFYDRRKGTYYSRICVDGSYIYLGTYETALEAANAYAEASKKYHGEFGRSYLDD